MTLSMPTLNDLLATFFFIYGIQILLETEPLNLQLIPTNLQTFARAENVSVTTYEHGADVVYNSGIPRLSSPDYRFLWR